MVHGATVTRIVHYTVLRVTTRHGLGTACLGYLHAYTASIHWVIPADVALPILTVNELGILAGNKKTK